MHDFIVRIVDYTRCGDGSGQCIKVVSKCDGIQDCVNGWDEAEELCTFAQERQRFVQSGKFAVCICIINYSNKILFLQGIPFNVTVGGPADIDIYLETGRIVSFSDCTGGLCNATLEPTCLLSVKAFNPYFKGFIL